MKNKILALLLIFNVLAPTCFAQGIFDEANTMKVDEGGLIFKTGISTYSETGTWTEDGLGFMENVNRVTTEAGAVAIWDGVRPGDNGFYDIYVWKSVVENGDNNVMVSWFATGSSSGNSFIDCSSGFSGWEYVGTTNTSDLVFDLSMTASGNGVCPVSCFRLARTTKEKFLDYLANDTGDEIILKIGADNAMLNGNVINMTMGKAKIDNSRTMVPLRFLMEIMGAQVTWNAEEQKVDITYADKNIVFYVGKNEYSVNGEVKTLDSAPYIEGDRTMVPLRVFSESVDKKVHWDERGIVVISDSEIADYEEYINKGLGL